MKFNKYTAIIGTILLGYLPTLASAEDALSLNPFSPWYKFDAESGWHFDIGLGLEIEPTYAGSSNSETEIGGIAQAVYRTNSGHRFFATPGTVGAIYSVSPKTQFLAFLESEEGRNNEEEPLLNGLDPIDSTIEGQLTLSRRFGNRTLFATLQPDLTGDANKGLVWFIGGTYEKLSSNSKWRYVGSFDLSGGDEEYTQTEFGITQAESDRTGYRAFRPSSGLKSLTVGGSVEYYINKRYSILGTLEIENYLGDARDSPLIKDVGSSTTTEASILFRARF